MPVCGSSVDGLHSLLLIVQEVALTTKIDKLFARKDSYGTSFHKLLVPLLQTSFVKSTRACIAEPVHSTYLLISHQGTHICSHLLRARSNQGFGPNEVCMPLSSGLQPNVLSNIILSLHFQCKVTSDTKALTLIGKKVCSACNICSHWEKSFNKNTFTSLIYIL